MLCSSCYEELTEPTPGTRYNAKGEAVKTFHRYKSCHDCVILKSRNEEAGIVTNNRAVIYNRDVNAGINILHRGLCQYFEGFTLPLHFTRAYDPPSLIARREKKKEKDAALAAAKELADLDDSS